MQPQRIGAVCRQFFHAVVAPRHAAGASASKRRWRRDARHLWRYRRRLVALATAAASVLGSRHMADYEPPLHLPEDTRQAPSHREYYLREEERARGDSWCSRHVLWAMLEHTYAVLMAPTDEQFERRLRRGPQEVLKVS